MAGYDAVQYLELDPSDASKDVHVSVLLYMKPLVEFLEFGEDSYGKAKRWVTHTITHGGILSGRDDFFFYAEGYIVCILAVTSEPSFPLVPSGHSRCMLRLKNDTEAFDSAPKFYGLPARSRSTFSKERCPPPPPTPSPGFGGQWRGARL